MDSVIQNMDLPYPRSSTPTPSHVRDRFLHTAPLASPQYRPLDNAQPAVEDMLKDEDLTLAQKDLALRIHNAAKRIREWQEELENWKWTGSFQKDSVDVCSDEHIANSRVEHLTKDDEKSIVELCLAASPHQIQEYENRLDIIHEELAELRFDALKDFVLDLHTNSSAPTSRGSVFAASGVVYMDDFSYFTTQTLVRCLPAHSALVPELQAWSIRLSVMQEIPHFLHHYYRSLIEMRIAWKDYNENVGAGHQKNAFHGSGSVEHIKTRCHQCIASTAKALDAMLDMLEGSDDIIPNTWIDAFEQIEADFGDWCAAVHHIQFTSDEEREATRITSTEVPIAGTVATDDGSMSQSDLTTLRSLSGSASQHDISKSSEIPSWEAKQDAREFKATEPLTAVLSLAAVHPVKSLTQAESAQSALADHQTTEDIPAASQAKISPAVSAAQRDEQTLAMNPIEKVATSLNIPAASVVMTASEEDTRVASPTRRSHDSDLSIKSSDQSLLGDSIFSEKSATNATDVTSLYDAGGNNTNTPILRPETPISYDDDELGNTYYDDLLDSIISEFDDVESESEPDESPLRRKQPISTVPVASVEAMMRKRPTQSDKSGTSNSTTGQAGLHGKLASTKVAHKYHPPSQSGSSSIPLELQISNILEAIPTPIRLQSRFRAKTPEIKRTRAGTTSSEQEQGSQAGSRSSTPSLTLAPAEENTRRRGSGSSEIRVYHLMSAGQEKPIKLFIRRVGEHGERVMVRVGGGWADLGEYLRIYAEHHGRRTISEGRIEMQALKIPKTGSTPKKSDSRRASLLSSASRSSTPVLGRSMTPTLHSGKSLRTTTMMNDTPAITAAPTADCDTPHSLASDDSSRRTPAWDEVGLSGPRARRAAETASGGERHEWIDGIVEQAKRDLGQHVQVGDLGKSGSTRRVFFKGRKPSGV